ncbi:MAG TPA: amidase [Acidimicrobiales bacterium]|nr:amidase [Acidimicrobiales bacterium]
MPDDFDTFQTARATAAAIRKREVSPLEVLDACLARVDAVNEALNVVIWRNDEEARETARAAGDAVVNSDVADLPPFHGVPIPIKDLSEVAGWPVTYGSWSAGETPSQTSDLVVEALQRAGFVLTCRTNTPEFGLLLVAENDRYGISRNPWDLDRTPGGSTGAAAAVAGGMFPIAHGGDGAGSLRVPASCCGLVGLKVSRGRVPALVNHWEGAAVPGVLTRDVADTASVLDLISGPDRLQWYNAPPPERPFIEEVGAGPGRLRVGLMEEAPLGFPVDQPCIDAVRLAAAALEDLGHSVDSVGYQVPDEVLVAFLNVVNSDLGGYDVDWEKTEPHVRGAREAAHAVDSLVYERSVYQLQRWSREFVAQWGRDFDILLSPTISIEPPKAGEVLAAAHETGATPIQVLQMAVFTSGFNMSGQPAISVPTHMAPSGLPIGVQLVAGPWQEAQLLRVAAQLEEALPWAGRRPVL